MANIFGTSAADIIIPGFNSADSGLPSGNDTIYGLGGADYLNGGPETIVFQEVKATTRC